MTILFLILSSLGLLGAIMLILGKPERFEPGTTFYLDAEGNLIERDTVEI